MLWLSTAIFGVLVLGGGVAGYARAKSRISLLAGVVSGLVLLYAAFALFQGRSEGIPLAMTVSMLLAMLFLVRWRKTGAFMPAGMLLILSLLQTLILLFLK
jgi:uncharacterized membrane protein (UPF0136 family)